MKRNDYYKIDTLKSRRVELDVLRLLAMLAVIITHLCGSSIKTMASNVVIAQRLQIIQAGITWHVPVFVMISGSLFLKPEKEMTIAKIFRKYILHLLVCFAVWSAAFQMYYRMFGESSLNWRGMISEGLIGPYPFWYLWMLMGLYMIVPFLRSFSQDRKLVQYFLILFFVGEFVVNYGVILPGIGSTVEQIVEKSNFYFVLGFTGYYLLGHYLTQEKLSARAESGIYLAGLAGFLFTMTAVRINLKNPGTIPADCTKYLTPNVILESAAIFTFFTKRVSKIPLPEQLRSMLKRTTELGFGVYLVHGLVIEGFTAVGLNVLIGPLPITVPLLMTGVYLVCLGIVWLIRKIPVIGKNIT